MGEELWAVSWEAGGERDKVVHQLDCGRVLSTMKYRAISRDRLQSRCQTMDSCDWIMAHVSTLSLSHTSLFNHLQVYPVTRLYYQLQIITHFLPYNFFLIAIFNMFLNKPSICHRTANIYMI